LKPGLAVDADWQVDLYSYKEKEAAYYIPKLSYHVLSEWRIYITVNHILQKQVYFEAIEQSEQHKKNHQQGI